MRYGKYLFIVSLVIAAVDGRFANATDIYRWVDDDGVIHFSDTQPGDVTDVNTLTVNATNPPGYEPGDDPYSIANQAKRMNEKWSALAAARDKREEDRRDRERSSVQYQASRYDGWRYSYWPSYYTRSFPGRSPSQHQPTIRRQANTLDALNLTGPRPHSINSGAHRARVESSKNFLQTVTKPAPRPMPRGN